MRGRLSALIRDDAARTELVARAAEVAARLSPESMTQGYLGLYRKLAGRPARSEMTHAARA
jgi:hypothetical protein